MALRTIKGTPCCQGTVKTKPPASPVGERQCKRAAETGFVTCASHRTQDDRAREPLSNDELSGVFKALF